jgi:O-acetyl-ADP-ribose deacetylase (regulator of RNase III)
LQKRENSNSVNTIRVVQGDITRMAVDAIVNAANRSLLGGGGVDGAIHHAAGPDLLAACRSLKGCATGDAKMTAGYHLPARYVIHTVGPVWHGGLKHEEELLQSCYRRSLAIAVESGLKSVAFPNISTGVYGFPKEKAAAIAIDTVKVFLQTYSNIEVIFCCFDKENYQLYLKILENEDSI